MTNCTRISVAAIKTQSMFLGALVLVSGAVGQPEPFTWKCRVTGVTPAPPPSTPHPAPADLDVLTSTTHPPPHLDAADAPPRPPKSDYTWSDGFNKGVGSNGTEWTRVVAVSAKNITAARAAYPNQLINLHSFPGVVFHLTVSPAVNLTSVECQWASGSWTATSPGSLFAGGTLGAILSANSTTNPVPVQSFAEFNQQRYGKAFAAVSAKKRPVKFPVVDRWINGDSDLNCLTAGIKALSDLGLNGISW